MYHVHSVQHYHPKCIACIFFFFILGRGSDSNSHISEECWYTYMENITSIQQFFIFLQMISERYFMHWWHIDPVMMAQHCYLAGLKVCCRAKKENRGMRRWTNHGGIIRQEPASQSCWVIRLIYHRVGERVALSQHPSSSVCAHKLPRYNIY